MPRVNVRLDPPQFDRLAKMAKSRGCTLSDVVRDSLDAALDPATTDSVEALEQRIAATLDRYSKDLRSLHTADQALYAAFDTFVRLFLTCIPDPPPTALAAAKMQAQERYRNYLQNVAKNMNGAGRD